MTRLLLDTCACLWILDNAPLADAAVAALDEAFDRGDPIWVSTFSAWEVGMLTSRGRLALAMPPDAWFHRVLQVPGVREAPLSPEELIASSFLPGSPPRDPADRILLATARRGMLTIVTRDRLILDYAETGHVAAIAC